MKKLRTSFLWWLGFGFFLNFENGVIRVKKGYRSVSMRRSDIKGVRVERRFFRGHTLVIETLAKPIYFRGTSGQVSDAQAFILSLPTR